jgi:hypothetical protein
MISSVPAPWWRRALYHDAAPCSRRPRFDCIAITALLVACNPAVAADSDPSRGVFPGARLEADNTVVLTQEKTLRIPGTSKERTVLGEGTRVARQASVKVRAQGRLHEVEMWAGDDVGVLAVFPAGVNAPTDVADVQTDRTPFLGTELISLGGDDAFTVSNSHHNAGEGFNETSLFHLRDGRLRRIAVVPTYSVMAGCAKAYSEELRWRVEADGGELPTIIADVDTTHAPADFTDGCKGKPKEWHEHKLTRYRWSAAKDRYLVEAKK